VGAWLRIPGSGHRSPGVGGALAPKRGADAPELRRLKVSRSDATALSILGGVQAGSEESRRLLFAQKLVIQDHL
jgi:hypothetical protein